MNEQLQEKGIQVLDFILQSLTQAKDFVIEQAPDVVKQLLMMDMINEIIPFSLCVLGIIISIIASIIFYKKIMINKEWAMDNKCLALFAFTTVFGACVTLPSIIYGKESLTKILQIKYTPKAYLINKFVDTKGLKGENK